MKGVVKCDIYFFNTHSIVTNCTVGMFSINVSMSSTKINIFC